MPGNLTTIVGPMGSGKTRHLFGLFEEYRRQGYEIHLFKHQIDDRDKEPVCSSRAGHAHPATIIRDTSEIDRSILDDSCRRVISFEEGEFFASDLVDFVRWALRKTDHSVIVTGLNIDFKGDPFGYMPQLMAMSDEIIHLKGECDVCHGFATRTQRIIDGQPAPADSPLILIGGDESYTCRCPECYILPG
jgi:thymidine kinase